MSFARGGGRSGRGGRSGGRWQNLSRGCGGRLYSMTLVADVVRQVVLLQDLKTERTLLKCPSDSCIFPMPEFPSSKFVTNNTSSSALFASSDNVASWLARLGHPGVVFFTIFDFSQTYFYLDLIHSDLWSSPCSFMSGYRYYAIFVNDFS